MIKQHFPAIILSIAFVLLLFFLNNRSSLNFVEEQKIVPTIIPTSTETEWKTYTNSQFGFSVQYPNRFTPSTELKGDQNYQTVAELSSNYGESLNINLIKNIDIYKNASVLDVAKREIMDSGYKYEVTPTTINKYSAAITVVNDSNIRSISVTIKHLTKNIYVVLVLPRDLSRVEFDQILSTFKFTN